MLRPEVSDTAEKPERLVVPLWPDTGMALDLGKTPTYEAAHRGEIPTIRFGRLLKVPIWFYRRLRDGVSEPTKAA